MGEIHVLRSVSRLARQIGEDQIDRLAKGQQMQASLARQQFNEMILGADHGLSPGVSDASAEALSVTAC